MHVWSVGVKDLGLILEVPYYSYMFELPHYDKYFTSEPYQKFITTVPDIELWVR